MSGNRHQSAKSPPTSDGGHEEWETASESSDIAVKQHTQLRENPDNAVADKLVLQHSDRPLVLVM